MHVPGAWSALLLALYRILSHADEVRDLFRLLKHARRCGRANGPMGLSVRKVPRGQDSLALCRKRGGMRQGGLSC